MTVTKRSNANPLGLNGFEVYGTAKGHRPAATGWTDWGTHDHEAPALKVADDGTVPLESGWTLTMDDWAGAEGAELSLPVGGHQPLAARDRAGYGSRLPGGPGSPARPGRRG